MRKHRSWHMMTSWQWKRFSQYWPFVRGVHRSSVYSPLKGWVMQSFIDFFDIMMNKILYKQSSYRWFEMSWRSTDVSVMSGRDGYVRCMMTSSNGNIFRVTGRLCGEFTGPGEFPAQRPVTRSFDVFFDLRPNERLSKQPWGWWFETPSWSLWGQCNGNLRSLSVSICSVHYSITS